MSGIFESDCCLGPFQHLHLTDEETEALGSQEHYLRSCWKLGREVLLTEKKGIGVAMTSSSALEQQSRVVHHSHPPFCASVHALPLQLEATLLFVHSVKSVCHGQQRSIPKGVILWFFHLHIFLLWTFITAALFIDCVDCITWINHAPPNPKLLEHQNHPLYGVAGGTWEVIHSSKKKKVK